MKIIITRAFEKTKQVAQYEPVKSFCSVGMEFETGDDVFRGERMAEVSQRIDSFVRSEVHKTIADELKQREMEGKPACAVCGGKQVYGGSGLSAEGLCKPCESSVAATKRDLKSGKAGVVDFGQ